MNLCVEVDCLWVDWSKVSGCGGIWDLMLYVMRALAEYWELVQSPRDDALPVRVQYGALSQSELRPGISGQELLYIRYIRLVAV